MRIASIVPELEPIHDQEGGAISRIVAGVLTHTPTSLMHCTTYAPPPRSPVGAISLAPHAIRHYGAAGWSSKSNGGRRPIGDDVIAEIVAEQYDAIEVHNRPGVVERLRRAGFRGKMIYRMHNELGGVWKERSRAYSFLSATDRVLPVSQYLLDGFIDIAHEAGTACEVVSGGVDTELFSPQPLNGSRGGSHLDCVVSGRICSEKGQLAFIKNLASASTGVPPLNVSIVGSAWFGRRIMSRHEAALRLYVLARFAQSKHKVTFVGQLGHAALASRLQRADLYLYTGTWAEPFGLAGLEAMAAGVPVIAFNVGGVSEALADGAVLVEPDDYEEYFRQISLLKQDPKAMLQLSQSGRNRALSQFSWPSVATRWQAAVLASLG